MNGQKLKIYDENGNELKGLSFNHEPQPLSSKESKGWKKFVNWLRFGGKPSDWIDIDELEDKLFDDELA